MNKTQDSNRGGALKLFICAAGIFFSYLFYGFLQEKITKGKYGDEQEKFHYTLSMVFIQCIVNALIAYLGRLYLKEWKDENSAIPQKFFATMSITYLGAMLASNHALQFVPYPTQVLGKSVKPIPVMILGVLLAGKKYPLKKYLFIILIVAGVALFMYKEKKAVKANVGFGFGEILLIISLLLDGGTGSIQDKIRSKYVTKTFGMMLFMNAWSVLYLGIGLFLTGEVYAFATFSIKYPIVLFHIIVFSLASAIGQFFIFMTVTNFGPLTCSVITTTRKFFTILCSVFFFGHPMIARQWFGTLLVFIGLGLDSAYGKQKTAVDKK